MHRRYSQCLLAPKEKAAEQEAPPGEIGDDPCTIVDEDALLPAEGASVASTTKKTAAEQRRQLAADRHTLNQEIGLGIMGYYPEEFSNKLHEMDPRAVRNTKSGFVRGAQCTTA